MFISFGSTVQPSMGHLLEATDWDRYSHRQVSLGPAALLEGMFSRVMVAAGLQRPMVLCGEESWSLLWGRSLQVQGLLFLRTSRLQLDTTAGFSGCGREKGVGCSRMALLGHLHPGCWLLAG